tara:strand:+ start:998 stop:1345 length:348 start_codon:yes stop_codon:yes gene_type:complete
MQWHVGPHDFPAAKQMQYNFKHLLFLQLHPSLSALFVSFTCICFFRGERLVVATRRRFFRAPVFVAHSFVAHSFVVRVFVVVTVVGFFAPSRFCMGGDRGAIICVNLCVVRDRSM